ncbi:MAG TPA: ABC transporter ATP-binding protein [Clostridiaceae bacterium]|nr:ABC transporter ATP-binding protein [Clostridiaceae bacterium]
MSYIKFKQVNKSFGSNHVLQDISLEIEKGQLVTLLGPSGCGKSTLLRCLAGLEDVDSGSIFLEDKDITDVSPKNRGMGMVFQQYSLFPNLTTFQNVAFGLKMKKMDKAIIKEKVDDMLEIVGLSEAAKQYPAQMSGGQQQRAALARALVTDPKVLLLDEPLSAIDAKLRQNLQVEIRNIQRNLDITAIFVTHDQNEAMIMSDQIFLMNNGKIEQADSPTDLYTNPKTEFVASFMGSYNILSKDELLKAGNYELSCDSIAFRPEMVTLQILEEDNILFEQSKKNTIENVLELYGTVTLRMPHGNFLRYSINCSDITIKVDTMFTEGDIIHSDTKVKLTIPEKSILYY